MKGRKYATRLQKELITLMCRRHGVAVNEFCSLERIGIKKASHVIKQLKLLDETSTS